MAAAVAAALALAGCAGGGLPDRGLTPGAVRGDLTLAEICAIRWDGEHRAVTAAMKRQVYGAYGLDQDAPPCPCEIDHLIPRSLGGADDPRNLWPQPYEGSWNARQKDRLEAHLHRAVCDGRLPLEAARRGIAADWRELYRREFGE
jgi:hypothetical protein